jgi:hypothetical protein
MENILLATRRVNARHLLSGIKLAFYLQRAHPLDSTIFELNLRDLLDIPVQKTLVHICTQAPRWIENHVRGKRKSSTEKVPY